LAHRPEGGLPRNHEWTQQQRSAMVSRGTCPCPIRPNGVNTKVHPGQGGPIMPLLEVHGLVKIYGRRRVVDGVDYQVDAGEVVGLLGPNGAGKTTSFRMTTGQITPNDGHVAFNGNDVTPLPMFRRARLGMGYMTQEPSIFRKLTIEKNPLAILEALPRSRSRGRRL